MVTNRKLRIYQILLLGLAVTLSNCLTDQYDLSKGVNTDMSVGGDSLSIPLLKDSISLGKLLTTNDSSLIKEDPSDGSYSILMKDSMHRNMDAINPITFEVIPISKLSPMSIPNLDIPDNQKQVGFGTTFDMGANLSTASLTKRLSKTSLSTLSQTISNPTIVIRGKSTFNQSLNFTFPIEPGKTSSPLLKINNIKLMNSEVTMTFVKTVIPSALTTIEKNTLDSFEIDFPPEFELAKISGYSGTVEKKNVKGKLKSVYSIINTDIPKDNTPFTAKFKIVSLDVSNIDQDGSLVYNEDIPYSIKYSCTGVIVPPLLPSDELKVNVSINASSLVDDMEIVTNTFAVPVASGNVPINQTIDIPKEITSISAISFNDGAKLNLSFIDPGISPFTFSESNCSIYLPKTLILKPYNGLDLSTNTLTVSSKKLFTPIIIGIEGIRTDKTDFKNQKMTVSDALVYDISGLNIEPTTAMLKNLPSNKTLQIKVNGSTNGLTVSTIVGKINPFSDPISQNIKLDLPDVFKNNNNNLDIKNPVIELEFGNTMGFPIDIPMNLIPKSKGVAIPNATITTTLHIFQASVLGQSTSTKFRLSATGKDTAGIYYLEGTPFPDGYISKPIANLANLLKTIPDSIEIKVTPQIDQTKDISIDLNPTITNKLNVKYAVYVPLDFGDKFKFQYDTIINDLKKSLSSFKLPKQVDFIAKIDNKIPMNLALKLSPLDANGDVIQGISITTDSIKYDSKVHSTQTSVFSLKENPANLGDFDKLDKINLTVTATKNPATSLIPLKADQYFRLELRVRIPDGITIDTTKK